MRFGLLLLAALCFSPTAIAQEERGVVDTALSDMRGFFRSGESHPMLPGANVGVTLHGPTYAYVSESGAVAPLCVMTNVYLYYSRGENVASSQTAPGQGLVSVSEAPVYRLAFSEPGREPASQDVANAACREFPADRGWFSVSGLPTSDSGAVRDAANAALRLTRALRAGADRVDDLSFSGLGGSAQAISTLRGETIDRLARLEFSECEDNDLYWCNVVKVRFGECGPIAELTLTLHTRRPEDEARIARASVGTAMCMY
ncbi:MAG: hypothetical protein ABL932_08800 [Terricaulis sp.]